jgi:hypothetical protein
LNLSLPGLIWSAGFESLTGNLEDSNRSSRSHCGISTENDDCHQRRGIDKYGPTLPTGVGTMDADVTRRLSPLVVLQCPRQAQTLSWYQSDTLG